MFRKRSLTRKPLAILFSSIFFLSNISYGVEINDPDYKLAAPNISQEVPFTKESLARKEGIIEDKNFMGVALFIAREYLTSNNGHAPERDIREDLRFAFEGHEDLLEGYDIDLDDITVKDNELVIFRFKKNNKARRAWICTGENVHKYRTHHTKDQWVRADRWEECYKYHIYIEPVEEGLDHDLKGEEAPETDPLIKRLILDGQVVELYLDENGVLNAGRVGYVKGYVPGQVSQDEYIHQELDIDQFLSIEERSKIAGWMKEHPVRGFPGMPMIPAKIRMVLGNAAIGWNSDVEHSNISHAGIRDKTIYIGSLLLKELLKDENKAVMKKVLDEDEYMHLLGFDHEFDDDYRDRLKDISGILKDSRLEDLRGMVLEEDVYAIRDLLETYIDAGDINGLKKLLLIFDDIILSQSLYPVESSYPIKKAVADLDKERQDKLGIMMTDPEFHNFRGRKVIDEILLLLVVALEDSAEADRMNNNRLFDWVRRIKERVRDKWIGGNTPELLNRSLWQISPEIWHEAGGLSRVMQYHGVGIKNLIGDENVRLRHVEPHYRHRIDKNGNFLPLDYTDGKQVTHPVSRETIEEKIFEYTVNVNGKKVRVEVTRGYNDLGIEVYMIRDVQEDGSSYYTHSLYNYRKSWENPAEVPLPTWEEFSVFYSKAVLKLIKEQEKIDKQVLKSRDREWEAPLLHLNDSQTALVSVYRRLLYGEDEILKDATVFATTHTYGNRVTYSARDKYGRDMLDFMDIPEDFRPMFKHVSGEGEVYDMATAMLRTSDAQSAVSRAHSDDVRSLDEWVNNNKVFVKKQEFFEILGDEKIELIDELWDLLIEKGYIDEYGIVQDNIVNVENGSQLDLNGRFGDKKYPVYWVLKTTYNNPEALELRKLAEKYGWNLSVRLVAISNGDHRRNTRKYFDKFLQEAGVKPEDLEHPNETDVKKAKTLAKQALIMDRDKYRASGEPVKEGEAILDHKKMLISYSGRLVPEKAGRGKIVRRDGQEVSGVDKRGAFADENIINFIKSGINVAIYGNVQAKNDRSDILKRDLEKLIDRINEESKAEGERSKGWGRLVFVPRFSLDEQRLLLAASDVQIQDSFAKTEAAGFTEADISACGGIEVGTYRIDNGRGEGLFQAQGVPMDLNKPGHGNILTPSARSAKAYREVITRLHTLYNEDLLKYYQATSVRLSRILEARLTAASYLREFNQAIKDTRRKKKAMEKRKEREEKDIKFTSLLDQVQTPDREKEPGEFDAYEVYKTVMRGEVENAVNAFFRSPAFIDNAPGKTGYAISVFNRIIQAYGKRDEDVEGSEGINRFLRGILERLSLTLDRSETEEAGSQAVAQLSDMEVIAAQALNIIYWIDTGIEGAEQIRLTTEEGRMSMAGDKERGPSFIDNNTLPEAVRSRVTKEGVPGYFNSEGSEGFYWRGKEKLSKMANCLHGGAVYDHETLENAREKLVMYIMDHGHEQVPEGSKKRTETGKVSTLHETLFTQNGIPGSYQVTSTGIGHFQGLKLDIKQVTRGSGIQFNVRYNSDGEVEEVIAQELAKGDWTFALPGYVDYVVNLGDLRFNDFSVELTLKGAKKFNPHIQDHKTLSNTETRLKTVLKDASAPYGGFRLGDRLFVSKLAADAPPARWIKGITPALYGNNELYASFRRGIRDLYGFIADDDVFKQLGEYAYKSFELSEERSGPSNASLVDMRELENLVNKEKQKERAVSSEEQAIEIMIKDNEEFLKRIEAPRDGVKRLVRVPTEWIDVVGVDIAKVVLQRIQNSAGPEEGSTNLYLELYKMSSIAEVPESEYRDYGIKYVAMPDELKLENRSRANTITIMPVFKSDEFTTSGKKGAESRGWDLGNMSQNPEKTIISPVGFNYDHAGLIRGLLLGLRLSEIAGNESLRKDSMFVSYTLGQYKDLCIALGLKPEEFDLTGEDLVNLARGDMRLVVSALNKVIKLLPIIPLSTEEIRMIYERAREALIRA